MIRATLLSAALLMVALPAAAQSTFDRFETVVVTMNGMMFQGMINETPALEGNMPATEWSDDLRTAYTCMYDGFVDAVGAPAVVEMVDTMEATLASATPEDILGGGGAVENPIGLTDEQALEIVGGCNLMDAFMEHLSSSGALQILMEQ